MLGERVGVALVADGDRGEGINAGGDVEEFTSALREDADHLVDQQAARGGFEGEAGRRGAEVVGGGGVWLAVTSVRRRVTSDREEAGVTSPDLVRFFQAAEDFGELRLVRTLGDDVRPGLFVSRRGGPARRFEERTDVGVGNFAIGHREGAPARGEVFVDWKVRVGLFELVHRLSSILFLAARRRK